MEGQNFTRVPNEFLDRAAHFKLPVQCWQVLIFIIRKSWGWNRKTVELRTKDIAEGTGLLPPNVVRSIKRLQNDKLLGVISTDNKRAKKYRINYKYLLSRQPEDLLSQRIKNVISTDNECYPYRQHNVISIDNNNSCKCTTDMHLQEPKEKKEKIKKNKEKSAESKKEFKKDSFLSHLDHKLKTEAEMVAAAQRQKQALVEWEKANSSSEAIHEK